MTIKDCTFYKNTAVEEGGAIKFTHIEPIFVGVNVYDQNTAKFGEEYSGYPVTLEVRSTEFTF